ncbi:MAG: DEAD/DEAH box helicase [Acidimicrobiales bacterium]
MDPNQPPATVDTTVVGPNPVDALHPIVATWFEHRFPGGPSAVQCRSWPAITQGDDVLVAAPTGSGKTLAGFLVAIDRLVRAAAAGAPLVGARVLYVSPLKALAVDVHHNLERPLAELAETACRLGYTLPSLSIGVRTGDTPAGERASLVAAPPSILVTTPESLAILLTTERGRKALSTTETVIVDEVHALVPDKRGTHLALSLERLEALCLARSGRRPQRIGLSATQRPIEVAARFLSGVGAGRRTTIVDTTVPPRCRAEIELLDTELGAVTAAEHVDDLVARLAARVAVHRTTLVFVNTRRMAERLAHLLAEHLADGATPVDADRVAAHHGSLSRHRRLLVEARLRDGELSALVATGSLELGIDVGPVDLVCQVGSPRSIATFLQRVGRSNHTVDGVPHGVLYPTTRDELVECVALLAAVRADDLDRLHPPEAPLDILAQHLVAEVAANGERTEAELAVLVRRAAPYASLSDESFAQVVETLSAGILTGRGRRMAHLHRDGVDGILRPRRGARLAALTSGGAIPESGDYRVVLDPEGTTVGTVNEDFAVESMRGDVFLLGTHSWRIARVEQGVVRVVDADGAAPTIPFWIGEAPSRTDELSAWVSTVRSIVGQSLARADETAHSTDEQDARSATTPPRQAGMEQRPGAVGPNAAVCALETSCGVSRPVAEAVVAYLATAHAQLGTVPTTERIVVERCFDEVDGAQLVVHAPFGARVNRALGLALRKRFCATFDFELQAAATDDAVLLSLGPQHSFPLGDTFRLLRAATAAEVLVQAVLTSPLFATRWRWTCSRALAVLRFRGGRPTPLAIQRMEADDLQAAVFPALAACQENTPPGPVAVPDHILVAQTVHDCLHEAMDADGLRHLLADVETGEVSVWALDTVEPSVLAAEILHGRPYTFLDDAPLEERRSRATSTRRGLPTAPRSLDRLDRLDPVVVDRVRSDAAPHPATPDELHGVLVDLVAMAATPDLAMLYRRLADTGRAASVRPDAPSGDEWWVAAERAAWVPLLWPGAAVDGLVRPVRSYDGREPVPPEDADVAVADVVRGHLEVAGPVTVAELVCRTALSTGRVRTGLARLAVEGSAVRGTFDPRLGTADGPEDEQWCSRRLLARIHAGSRDRRRFHADPASQQDFVRFLLRWQHVAPEARLSGPGGLRAVLDQLQGFEAPAAAWEAHLLPARLEEYDPAWLDALCLSGELTWGRFSGRSAGARRGAATPSGSTPIAFAWRDDLAWLLAAMRDGQTPDRPKTGPAAELLASLETAGALFGADLARRTGRLPGDVDAGLWDLVARGLATADNFAAIRYLLGSRRRDPLARRRGSRTVQARLATTRGNAGRWSLVDDPATRGSEPAGHGTSETATEDVAETVAEQLLARWGIVCWEVTRREAIALPWRTIVQALRRLEARGTATGGRFVAGLSGEQYATPAAVTLLDAVRRSRAEAGSADPDDSDVTTVNASDPLNVVGTLVPGVRTPAVRTRQVTYRAGVPDDGGVVSASLGARRG